MSFTRRRVYNFLFDLKTDIDRYRSRSRAIEKLPFSKKGHTPRTSAPRWSTRLKSLCRAPRRPNNVRVFLLNTSRNTFHRYIAPNPFRSPPRSRHIYFSPPHDRLADRIRGKVTALKDRTYSDKSKGKGFGDIAEGETYEVVEWKKCESSQHNCSVRKSHLGGQSRGSYRLSPSE